MGFHEGGGKMTVQTFIVNYNYTFIYLHENFGKSDVVDLWKKLGDEFCVELRRQMDARGLEGNYEFFYGEDGISSREHVQATTECAADHYREELTHCPSVNEMVERDKKRYRHYCEHCYWLYSPCFEKNGFSYDVKYGLQEDDVISDSCCITSVKREKS
jgi:hypothetical protein